jgi:hypothetical protein
MHFITVTMCHSETVTCKSAIQYRSKLNPERTDEVSMNYCQPPADNFLAKLSGHSPRGNDP